MAETIYSVGTVTVANGGTTVTGVGTSWQGKIFEGDLFTDPAQGIFARVTADATSNTSLTINPWPGTALSGDAYEILLTPDSVRASERTRQLLEQLSVVQANGRGLFYRFSDSVTDADPGAGYVRLNNADPTLATAAYIDVLDANGATVSGEIDTWDDSTSLGKGNLWVRSIADPSAFHSYKVTGAVVDGTGYRKLTLTYVGGSGSFAADDEVMVAFARTGDTGEGYVTDATVADPSELTALEGEAAGYLVFVTDLQTDFGAYSGRSGVVELIAGPDWQLVAVYTGPKGDTGNQGDKGWSPQLVIVSDGARRVFQLAGYVGGAGTTPTANVGEYLKGDGTFTATIGDAVDVRGPAGLNGAGTVASVEPGTGILVDNTDPTAPVVSVDPDFVLPTKGHIYGLTLSNNATDVTNDIDIAAGEATSSDGTTLIVLATAITKRLDAAWAVGSGNGGLDTGSIANGTYHVHLILRPDTGVEDVLFSLSATAPTLPANYTKFRRIGSILRESAAIVPFQQFGDLFIRNTAVLSNNSTSNISTLTLTTLNVPTGIVVEPILSGYYKQNGSGQIDVGIASVHPGPVAGPEFYIGLSTIASQIVAYNFSAAVLTDTAAQIYLKRWLQSGATLNFFTLYTQGWRDARGQL